MEPSENTCGSLMGKKAEASGNLEKILVKVPVKVKKGQIIGTYENSSKKEFYYSLIWWMNVRRGGIMV